MPAATLAVACAIAAELVADDRVAAAWNEPSVLTGYSVGGLAAHLLLALERTEQVLDQSPPDPSAATLVSLTDYYGRARMATGGSGGAGDIHAAVRASADKVAERGHPVVAARFAAFVARLPGRLAADDAAPSRLVPVLLVPGGASRLDDYLRTRVVEAVIHADDIARSVGADDPTFPIEVVDLCASTLLELCRARGGDLSVLRQLAGREPVDDLLRAL